MLKYQAGASGLNRIAFSIIWMASSAFPTDDENGCHQCITVSILGCDCDQSSAAAKAFSGCFLYNSTNGSAKCPYNEDSSNRQEPFRHFRSPIKKCMIPALGNTPCHHTIHRQFKISRNPIRVLGKGFLQGSDRFRHIGLDFDRHRLNRYCSRQHDVDPDSMAFLTASTASPGLPRELSAFPMPLIG